MGMGVGMGMCEGMWVGMGMCNGMGVGIGIEKAHVNARVKANACQFLLIFMPIFIILMQKIILKRNFYNIYANFYNFNAKNNFKAQFY